MPFLVCIVAVCPLRTTASHRSEQSSQLLFGDVAEIIEMSGDFVLVRCLYDQYEGWCQRSQLAEINTDQFNDKNEVLASEFINEVEINNTTMYVPMGANVGNIGSNTQWEIYSVNYKGKSLSPGQPADVAATITQTALKYLNTSYEWGGRSVFGVDCSGFTQMVFRFIGVPLLRDAYQQASQGEAIGFLEEVRCGDLAFFDNEEGRITHVGILFNQSSIIHASGKVRIDAIDHQGIIRTDTGVRTHKLRVIKRII